MQSVKQKLDYETPFFLFDLDRVREKYEAISSAFGGAQVYYATKANNNEEVLKTLIAAGSKFEIGSKQEAEMMLGLGVSPKDLIFSSPVKLPSHIRDTYEMGLDLFVFDSEEELRKLAILAPKSRVLLRLSVGSEGSLFSLGLKFGALAEQALSLMQEALNQDLVPYGLAFHVGSQCTRKETWLEALETCSRVWGTLEAEGISMSCMDIGGGFPVEYIEEVPSIEEIAEGIRKLLNTRFPSGTELILEPGRYLVADSAMLVSSVIGKAKRNGENWLYVDVSAFHGLMEALQVRREFPYLVKTSKDGQPEKPYVLSGPTCDADDTILSKVWLPEMEVGDRVQIMNTGAYSFVYASNFHGFSTPEIRFVSKFGEQAELGEVRDIDEIDFNKTGDYGEEQKYVCEHEGQVCSIYYGITKFPKEWREKLWGIYNESLHVEDAVQDQSCYTHETFSDALDDSGYKKILMVVDGEPSGLIMGTNDLDKASVAYINPKYIRDRLPREVEEGRLWYVTAICVSPNSRHLGFYNQMMLAAINAIREKRYVIAGDVCDGRYFIPDVFMKLAAENGYPLEKRSLGSQSYYALVPSLDRELLKAEEPKS
jgi:ornithine decarboxylase